MRRTPIIRDIPSHGNDAPRLKCRACKQTFNPAVPEVDTGREMTERLVRWVGRQAIEYTYADIAKQVLIDEKTVRNVFDEYVAKAAYDLKERFYAIYEVRTPEEAWGEYLHWESTIPKELAKPFRVVKTACCNWRPYILNYFDDQRATNAFTESFNAKVRAVYRNGWGYTFERLRAKALYTDMLQKRVRLQVKVKVKRKPKFEEVSFARVYMMEMMVAESEPEYDVKIVPRIANLGTDLSTLEVLFDAGKF